MNFMITIQHLHTFTAIMFYKNKKQVYQTEMEDTRVSFCSSGKRQTWTRICFVMSNSIKSF